MGLWMDWLVVSFTIWIMVIEMQNNNEDSVAEGQTE